VLGAGLPESSLPALFADITLGGFSVVKEITPGVLTVVGKQVKYAYSLAYRTGIFVRCLLG
jgi:hypothetical protein